MAQQNLTAEVEIELKREDTAIDCFNKNLVCIGAVLVAGHKINGFFPSHTCVFLFLLNQAGVTSFIKSEHLSVYC